MTATRLHGQALKCYAKRWRYQHNQISLYLLFQPSSSTMDRLLGEIASALAVRQRNAAALERLHEKLRKQVNETVENIREGLDFISPAVFVQVMDSLPARCGGAPGSAAYRSASTLEVGGAAPHGAPRPDWTHTYEQLV
jgi:hypothetical protein